ncbi:MAG: helix-turn-helix domain-containing protein [Methyloceanibacter sp.]
MIVVEPIALTDDTAVLRRRDYDALIEAYEDAADALALAAVRAREAAGDAEYVPVELAERIFVAGEHPVRVWREHRGRALGALAKEAGIAQSYLSEIENGRKRGSVRALAALAKALRVDIEDLLAPER